MLPYIYIKRKTNNKYCLRGDFFVKFIKEKIIPTATRFLLVSYIRGYDMS